MTQTEISATGTFKATPTAVKAVTITAAAAAATVIIRDGGAGGTVRISLNAPVGASSSVAYLYDPVWFATDVHCTIGGAGALVDIGY